LKNCLISLHKQAKRLLNMISNSYSCLSVINISEGIVQKQSGWGEKKMSRLQELKDVLLHIKLAWERKQQAALVMLINVHGSAYRLPGTKMMIASDGQMHGTISGGCLERDLYGWAEKAMEVKEPRIQKYDLSENETWGLGIGCKGELEMLILPISETDDFWSDVGLAARKEQVFTLILEVPSGRRLLIKKNGEILGNQKKVPDEVIKKGITCMEKQTRAEVFTWEGNCYVIDPVKPGERLIVAGAGHDAGLVAELAAKVGFNVTFLDLRADFNTDRYFPPATYITGTPTDIHLNEVADSCWVIMNHYQEKDEASLQLALKSEPRFVGVLGPRPRTEAMLANIGLSLSSGPIHSPIGLDLGAETMDEVALSIVSELMTVRSGRIPTPLHGRFKIHL
jgi:xanthine dehydrogenase accessory factor